jgi:hypothetical protein
MNLSQAIAKKNNGLMPKGYRERFIGHFLAQGNPIPMIEINRTSPNGIR